jgi:putative sterol carrier protein
VSDSTTQFFEELGSRGHQPLLTSVKGSVRFDLIDGRKTDSWLVRIDKGKLAVRHGGGEADCVFRGSRTFFEKIAAGKVNPVAARLRGAIDVEGDLRLAVLAQRLFPGPPSTSRRAAGGARGSR